MDLSPFAAIDPCGFPGLAVTQARDLGIRGAALELGVRVADILVEKLGDA
jgi:lipoyl(octanoyl) transferase